MLDFNSVPPVANAAGGDLNAQRDAIRADLLARLESVLMTLLPAGKKRGQKYLVGDVLGSPGDSLEVSLKGETAGLWHDHATGNLIACVYRYDPAPGRKEFRPWDAKRRKMAPPEPRPLYNQPGLVAAEQVILVEGEKCAQALIEAGITATTNRPFATSTKP